MKRVPFEWRPRTIPLSPCALLALDSSAIRLANHLLSRGDDYLVRLKGAARKKLILILGHQSDLPWVDGLEYFGIDPAAPTLLLPTHSTSFPDIAVVARALSKMTDGRQHIVDAKSKWLIPTGAARPLDRKAIGIWLEQERI
jgi:hypothetical protein